MTLFRPCEPSKSNRSHIYYNTLIATYIVNLLYLYEPKGVSWEFIHLFKFIVLTFKKFASPHISHSNKISPLQQTTIFSDDPTLT